MSQKKQLVRFTSPRGRAIYPHLHTPDTKFKAEGEYKVKLAVPAAAAEKLVEQVDAAMKEALEIAKREAPKGKKVKEADLPYTTNPDTDEVEFSFKMKASGKTKTGEVFTQKPALFDAKGVAIGKAIKIGGGSVLRISGELNPYYTAAAGAGVQLRMKAVQVIELKEYGSGGTASSYGFGEEDGGFEASSVAGSEFTEETEEKAAGTDTDGDGSDF